MGGYAMHRIIRSKQDEILVLPYLDFVYGKIFARVDTLGVKTVALGYGDLELVGRVSLDGFHTNTAALQGLTTRRPSAPIGLGTLQITPVGAFMINAFHDVNQSKGNWLELTYGAEFDLPKVTLYPLVGAEYQSKAYVRYFYGVTAQEAANSQYAAYQPDGAFNNFIGLIADIPLAGEYHLNLNVRRKWLGDAINLSPIVSQGHLDTSYFALSYPLQIIP
ncbi:MAG: MipA/OmpV family protein [Nitrosomonadales bacterium]